MTMLLLALALAADPTDGLDPEATAHARVLLDDRATDAERIDAVRALAAQPDPVWLLRAAARDRVPELQTAIVDTVARHPSPEGSALLGWIVADGATPRPVRGHAVDTLAGVDGPEAGAVLYTLASDRDVPGDLRMRAREALRAHHAELLATRGDPRPVTDPVGGLAFVGAWGVAGGVGLEAVGEWGRFDGGPVVGAIGGSAIGLGASGYAVSRTPLTAGQGLAQLSGTAWGLAAGLWASDAALGRPRSWGLDTWAEPPTTDRTLTPYDTYSYTYYEPYVPIPRDPWQRDAAAAFRLAGVGIGSGLGLLWAAGAPDAADVLEIDLATYLGSAVALSGTALAVWRPPTGPTRDDLEARYRQQQILDASNLGGAALGMGLGVALHDRWQLDPEDVGYATVLGLEAAWVGLALPPAVGVDADDLKGTVRLPWNAAMAGGLALAELHPMPWTTTAVTAVGAGAGNALGAGLPLLAGADDDAVVNGVMVPVGIVGTAAGTLAAPWLDPQEGDWAMTGVVTGMATYNLGGVGMAADLDGGTNAGLMLVGGGSAAVAGLTAGRFAAPDPDDMLVLTSAAAWGSFYGILTPIAAFPDLDGRYPILVAAGAADLVVGGTALALSDAVGLTPRDTVVPQLLGLTGGTVGALATGLGTGDAQAVAAGALGGATLGLVGGGLLAARSDRAGQQARHVPRIDLPGHWRPTVAPTVVDGHSGVYVGVEGVGW